MKWDFKHYPNREYAWQAYYSPMGWEVRDVYNWCHLTFGKPGAGRWDNLGGWIKFRDEADMVLFLLRWA